MRTAKRGALRKSNMKKNVTKALAVVAAVAMVSMTSVGVMAAESNGGGTVTEMTSKPTATTDVKYSVSATYTWSVPTEIDFTTDKSSSDGTATVTTGTTGNSQSVKVTNNVIPNGKKVHIVLQGTTNTFKVKSVEGAELGYTVTVDKDATALKAGDKVLDVEAGTASGTAALTFKLTKASVEKAGSYSDKITYEASIADVISDGE